MSQENQQYQSLPATIQPSSGSEQSKSSVPSNLPSLSANAGALALADWADSESAFFTNLPMELPEDVERLSALMGVSDGKSKNFAGQTLALVGCAVDWGKHGENDDGEILEGLRAHMLLDDGKVVFTTSAGVLRALRMAMKCYGRGVWSPPILLELRSVPSKRGDALVGILRGRKGVAGKGGKK